MALVILYEILLCHFPDMRKTHLMREDLSLLYYPFVDVSWMKHVGHDKCRQFDVHTVRLKFTGHVQRSLSFVDVSWLMCRPILMSPIRCTDDPTYVCRS